MKTIEQIKEEVNISLPSFLSAKDNGSEALDSLIRYAMTHAIIASSEKATRLEDHKAILALIEEIK